MQTKWYLETILPRFTKGTNLRFENLLCTEFSGEALAVLQVLGLSNYSLKRSILIPRKPYIVIE